MRKNNKKRKKQIEKEIKELDDKMLIEYIGKHLFERCFFYEQANKKVIIDNKTIDEISKEIIKSLN